MDAHRGVVLEDEEFEVVVEDVVEHEDKEMEMEMALSLTHI